MLSYEQIQEELCRECRDKPMNKCNQLCLRRTIYLHYLDVDKNACLFRKKYYECKNADKIQLG